MLEQHMYRCAGSCRLTACRAISQPASTRLEDATLCLSVRQRELKRAAQKQAILLTTSHPITHLEDAALGLLVGQRELDFAVDPAGADEGGVQAVDTVGGHDHLQGW